MSSASPLAAPPATDLEAALTSGTYDQGARVGLASIEYAPAGSSAGAFVDWLGAHSGALGFDTETTGLDVREPGFAVRQVCFGTVLGHAFVIDGSDKTLVVACLQEAVKSGREIWAHNATYDAGAILSFYAVRLRGLRCSLVLARALDPDIIGTAQGSLKALRPATEDALVQLAAHWSAVSRTVATVKGEHAWLADAVRALPPSEATLLTYVATDAVECVRLVEDWRENSTPEEWDIAHIENRIEDLWRWPANRGYDLDTGMLDREIICLENARRDGEAKAGIDLTSNSDATRRWVTSRGIQIQDRDGKATLSHKHYDRAFVPEDAKEDWAFFAQLRAASTTATKLGEMAKAERKGRIYPSIRGIGASTGRMSIAKPAIQNLTGGLRGLLLADTGTVLIGCDLDRVEPRVIAALSEDADLIGAVQHDVYIELAVAVYGEEMREEIIADEAAAKLGEGAGSKHRKIAKTAFLAIAYGQGTKSLGGNLGISEGEAGDVIQNIRRAYPTMARWMSGIKWRAKRGELLTTAYGRPLPMTREAPYRAVNWVIQGTAADLFKRITLDVADALPRDSLWLPVHDELIVQVAEGTEEEALRVLGDAMTTELMGVPITGTPMVIGHRLGHA